MRSRVRRASIASPPACNRAKRPGVDAVRRTLDDDIITQHQRRPGTCAPGRCSPRTVCDLNNITQIQRADHVGAPIGLAGQPQQHPRVFDGRS
jgi:hypothetical protein